MGMGKKNEIDGGGKLCTFTEIGQIYALYSI